MEAANTRFDSGICFRNEGGREVRGTLLHLAADAIIFEVYSPYPVAEAGETLQNVRVFRGGNPVYSGEATVRATLATGMTIILTATPTSSWATFDDIARTGTLSSEARALIAQWGNSRALLPEYQVAVSNIRAFLTEMSQWLAPLDVAADAAVHPEELQEGVAQALYASIGPRIKDLFSRYEDAFEKVPAEEAPAHRAHAQRELHPLVLCAPLIHRSYVKPMGYAGDYGTVKMILENRIEGPSTYARVLNAFFTNIDICQGHRNRIDRLTDMLHAEVRRHKNSDRPVRVLNLGCGPVDEVCRFIKDDVLSERCEFTLLDFSQPTIEYAKARIEAVCRQSGRWPKIEFVHQSINDLLKEALRNGKSAVQPRYELAYCAGLFDYLSDRVCSRLMDLLYDWVVPGGLVVATNVHPRYRTHAILEDLAEWHLILRDENEMQALTRQRGGETAVDTEPSGVNVFLDVRKPEGRHEFVRNTVQRRLAAQGVPGV